jgi:FixJ family two-component response regulator/predicted transcriptional regulator
MQINQEAEDAVKILVVDDEECAVEELVFALCAAGFNAIGANSASRGLEYFLKDDRIGVVVSDIRMPMQDGIGFLQKIRRCGERGAACSLILMTGFPEISSAIEAIDLRVARYLQKPFEPDEALAVVSAAVSSYRRAVEASDANDAAVSALRALLLAPTPGAASTETAKPGHGAETPENREQRRTETLRSLLRFRKQRSEFLPQEMFGDPAWFMFLELAHLERSGKATSVSGLCMSANISQTTALRRIQDMVEAGLIVRHEDPRDKRRSHINLTTEANERLNQLLDRAAIDT